MNQKESKIEKKFTVEAVLVVRKEQTTRNFASKLQSPWVT